MGISKDGLIVLKHLRQDSRKSLSMIGREEKISLPRLVKCLRELEKEAIVKHYSHLELGRLGYNIKVYLVVGTQDMCGLESCIMKSKNVNSCQRISNGELFLECFFRDLKELEDFKEEISSFGITRLEEHFVMEELKREGFVPE